MLPFTSVAGQRERDEKETSNGEEDRRVELPQ